MSLGDLDNLCVARFPLSTTRRDIMAGFRAVIDRIIQCGIAQGEIWVNGSFLTEKIDAGDVDFCLLVPSRFYDSGTDKQRATIDWLNSRENEPKRLFHCDTVAEIIYPEKSPLHYLCEPMLEHWRNTYGRSVRTREPKGIAVVSLGAMNA
jgi:hypothetical protein